MQFDLIISNALVYDGTGRQPYKNDVGVSGDKILAIGNLGEAKSKRTIDARGLALCPGFVDIHSHADMCMHLDDSTSILEPLVRQGITTFVGGNCGVAMGPVTDKFRESQLKFYDFFLGEDQEDKIHWKNFSEMLDFYEKKGSLLNFAMLAPHSILRMDVLDIKTIEANSSQIESMKKSLAECMEAGAVGMSTGLQYPAGLSSDQSELTELARVVHDYNGVFTSHLRSYSSDTIDNAVDEVIAVGRDAEVPVQISHLFWIPNFRPPLNMLANKAIRAASYLYNKKKFPLPIDSALKPILSKVAGLVAKGVPIGIDAMPTGAGFTHLLAFFPPWSIEGGLDTVKARLRDPKTRKEIKHSIEHGDTKWPHRGRDSWSMNLFKVMGWNCAFIMSVGSEKNRHLEGKSFSEIGEETGKHPFDVACDLLLEEEGRVLIFETATNPSDPLMELSLLQPLIDPNVSIVTDTIPIAFGLPSHLKYDCYPKFLGNYSREMKAIDLASAIRKCTYLPAQQLQLRKRGHIAEGNYADLVLFNPNTIKTNSSPTDPKHYPDGINHVVINGKVVVDPDGFYGDLQTGRLIRRGSM